MPCRSVNLCLVLYRFRALIEYIFSFVSVSGKTIQTIAFLGWLASLQSTTSGKQAYFLLFILFACVYYVICDWADS